MMCDGSGPVWIIGWHESEADLRVRTDRVRGDQNGLRVNYITVGPDLYEGWISHGFDSDSDRSGLRQ
jgi:hypothetical protein